MILLQKLQKALVKKLYILILYIFFKIFLNVRSLSSVFSKTDTCINKKKTERDYNFNSFILIMCSAFVLLYCCFIFRWHYVCEEIFSAVKGLQPQGSFFYIQRIYVTKNDYTWNFYIDDIFIGLEQPTENVEGAFIFNFVNI